MGDATSAVVETHISTVFFTAERAYKLLKPVRTTFLDHADRDRRLWAARRELDLNRRLAPDVYLGLADVIEDGRLVDHMIVMRRLPDDRRLSQLVAAGEPTDCIRSVARAVAAFHAAEPAVTDGAASASRDAVAANWEDNLADLERFVGTVLDRDEFEAVAARSRGYLAGREALFAARIRDGHVRDGHGDLLADDIFCLDDGPRILDCLAFRDDLRIGDVLNDIGFLAMDLHRLAGANLARQLLRWYDEYTAEHHPASLAHHYVAYRAHVRTKVACLRYEQGVDESAPLARRLHALARHHLDRSIVRLVLVGGGPGSGKSTLAAGLSEQLAATLLRSDELRKEEAGMGYSDRAFAPPGEGIYRPAMTEQTYAELLRRAEMLLERGESVILDASWTSADHRARARELAARCHAPLTELECRLPLAVAKERIARRLADHWEPSDALPEIVDHAASLHEPWPEALGIDTTQPPDRTLAAALDAVGPTPPGEASATVADNMAGWGR